MCMCICIYLENNLSLQTLSVLFKNKPVNLLCNLDERITTPVSDNCVQSLAITSRSVSFQSQMEASELQVLFYFDLFFSVV